MSFDQIYAANKRLADSLAASGNCYEMIFVHYPLHEMLTATGDERYGLESLRLYELQMKAHRKWHGGGSDQTAYHFGLEAARLCRIALPVVSGALRTRVLKLRDFTAKNVVDKFADWKSAEKRAATYGRDALGSQVVMLMCVAKNLTLAGRSYPQADRLYRAFLPRIEPFGEALIWEKGRNLPWIPERDTGFDTSHAMRHIHAFRTAHETGAPGYTTEMMRGFAKLIGGTIWNQDAKVPRFTNYIDGKNGQFSGVGPWVAGNVICGWPWLARFDASAMRAMVALREARAKGVNLAPWWGDNPAADLAMAAV